jgi:hypothetical protein
MNRDVITRALLGSIFVGIGVALLASASKKVCIDCDKGEDVLEDIAVASAELAEDGDIDLDVTEPSDD